MTHILSLGAINKQTGDYVYPKIANKKDEYVCPDCNKDLILCQGEIKRPHFRHKVDSVNPCNHYSNPTETQIHKDGKMVMKSLLEHKTPISFIRNCCSCKKNEEYEILEMTESSKIELEYRFEYNGTKIADVAYIDDNEILCIFEICNTHKTRSEKRPEPWFEIDAENLIRLANDDNLNSLQIPCIRCEKCDDCIEKEKRLNEEKKQQKIMSIKNSNKLKLPILESQLEIEIKNDTSDYYTSSLLTKLETQVRNIKSEIEIKLIENNINYSNNDNVKFEINHPNKDQHITLHSISSYSIIEILDWYNSVPNKFNIIDCQFKIEKLKENIWQSVKDKNIHELNSLILKLEKYIDMCLKNKYNNCASRFSISKSNDKLLYLEIYLVRGNIQYSKQDTAGMPIYIITLPNTKENIKYAMSSGKIYKNKKWHTSREINLYNLLTL